MTLQAIRCLIDGGIIDIGKSEILSERCRDVDLRIYRDRNSGVIFLDPNFEGHGTEYYRMKSAEGRTFPSDGVANMDTIRRAELLNPLVSGARWCDFGCGHGLQLQAARHLAQDAVGVDLNRASLETVRKNGFKAIERIHELPDFRPQLISMFHVLEHLSDPVSILDDVYQWADEGATLIVEVPHARDWLLTNGPQEFRDHTFWSEHIVLHTRQSLSYLLGLTGWKVERLIGLQRYPVWNHFSWCLRGRPSGFSADSYDRTAQDLHRAYEAFLAARDATDTLIAIVKKQA